MFLMFSLRGIYDIHKQTAEATLVKTKPSGGSGSTIQNQAWLLALLTLGDHHPRDASTPTPNHDH